MTDTKKRKEIAFDEAPAIINDHAFEPRGEWYTLCMHCGLANAAHAKTTIDTRQILRDHYHDTLIPIESRIGYYEDDFPDDDV